MFPFYRNTENKNSIKIFCFHHAGGSASIFRPWTLQQDKLAIHPVELPGKATRMGEDYIESGERLVQQLAKEIDQILYPGERFRLYGHSLGAMIAFKVAWALEHKYERCADKIILAARHTANIKNEIGYQTYMGTEALVDDMRRVGGTPDEILNNDGIMKCLLPDIIKDYRLNEDLIYKGEIIHSSLRIDVGVDDQDTSLDLIKGWRELTRGNVTFRSFPGGHFFPYEGESYYQSLEDDVECTTKQGEII